MIKHEKCPLCDSKKIKLITEDLKKKYGQIQALVHLDLYRLGTPEEARSFDLREIFSQPHDLILVEWAEKAEKLLPSPHYRVEFKHLGRDKREINIEKIS